MKRLAEGNDGETRMYLNAGKRFRLPAAVDDEGPREWNSHVQNSTSPPEHSDLRSVLFHVLLTGISYRSCPVELNMARS